MTTLTFKPVLYISTVHTGGGGLHGAQARGAQKLNFRET